MRADRPLHGYQIKQQFQELLGGTWDVNIGQVYQTLQRLERDRLVETTGDRPPDPPARARLLPRFVTMQILDASLSAQP